VQKFEDMVFHYSDLHKLGMLHINAIFPERNAKEGVLTFLALEIEVFQPELL
jgi:hypothetical protein